MVSIGRWSLQTSPSIILKRNGAIHFLKSYRKKMNKPGYKMIKLFDFPFMLQETTKNLHLSKEHADVIYPLSSVINPSPPSPFFLFAIFRLS